jgi:hypothetical protein
MVSSLDQGSRRGSQIQQATRGTVLLERAHQAPAPARALQSTQGQAAEVLQLLITMMCMM